METKTKLKTKWSDLPLLWQSTYEFVAPYDFDECIRRINALGAKYWDERSSFWNLNPTKFDLDSLQDNGGVFNFKMTGHQSKIILEAQLRGQLIYESQSQTRVKLGVGVTQSSVAILIGLLPAICALLLIISHASSPYEIAVCLGISAAIFCFIFIIDFFEGYGLKQELYYNLRDILTKNSPSFEKM